MSFNIEEYKTEHECDEHWDLRRKFMLAHKKKFPIDRLVCLAQVFINIEILGCRYPDETMRLVSKLSEKVAAEYRERKKGKLQRTFVQASDAAETRAKGVRKSSHIDLVVSQTSEREPKYAQLSETIKLEASSKKIKLEASSQTIKLEASSQTIKLEPSSKTMKFEASSETLHTSSPGPWQGEYRSYKSEPGTIKSESVTDTSKPPKTWIRERVLPSQTSLLANDIRNLLSKVIIIENTFHDCPASITVVRTLQLNNISTAELFRYTVQPNGDTCCSLFINDIEILSKTDSLKSEAKEAVSELFLEQLREFCYTIQMKARFVSETTVDTKYSMSGNANNETLSEDNVGNKLLRMMGWTGGGLGKNKQGIANPISVQEHINRAGLGHTNVKQELRRVLQNFARGDSVNDLAFSADFTKEERATIHELARTCSLRSKSHGRGDNRQIVISRKENPRQLLSRLIRVGGSTEKYDVIKPKCRQ